MRSKLEALSSAWIALAVLVVGLPAVGQRFATVQIGIEQGLPSPHVLDLEQDRVGRLWVGTRAGLATFDGHSFVRQRPFADGRNEDVAAIAADPDRNVWAISRHFRSGPAVYRDRRWQQPLPDPPIGKGRMVHRLEVGQLENGEVWVAVATVRSGILLGTKDGWQSLRPTSEGRFGRIFALERVGHRLYIASERGLSYWHGGDLVDLPSRVVDEIGGPPLALSADQDGRLWVLSQSWLGFLDGDRLVAVEADFELPLRPLANTRNATLASDGQGWVYFGTAAQLYRVAVQGGPVRQIGQLQGLVAEGVTSLLVDSGSNLWVGGVRGLSAVVAGGVLSWGHAQGLLENEVSALVEWPAPGRFVVGHNAGLTIWDGEQIEPMGFGERLGEETKITQERVMAFAQDRGGSLFLAAGDRGVGRLDSGAGLRWYGPDRGVRGRASGVAATPDGRVWATAGRDLHVLDRELDRFIPAALDGVVSDGVYLRGVLSDPEGLLFLPTSRGLMRGGPGDWRSIVPDAGAAELARDVFAVMVDGEGVLWVGTLAGLYRIDDGVWQKVESLSREIYSLVPAPWGGLLAGTSDGLMAFQGGKTRKISVEEGLIGRETNRGALWVEGQRKVWVGTAQGLSVVSAETLQGKVPLARLELTGLEVDGVLHAHDSALELGPGVRTMVFRFAAVALPTTRGLRYRSRLEGFDLGWSQPTSVIQNVLRYTNIPAGQYRLEIQLMHRDGSTSEILRSPRVQVRAPIWDQAWFKVVVGLLAFAMGLLLHYRGVLRRKRVRIDGLTGLGNRAALEEALGEYLEEKRTFALFFLDLDRFKSVHDALGRELSDRLLFAVGERLRFGAAEGDMVARLGGDEFVVLRREVTSASEARVIAESIQDLLKAPFSLEGRRVYSEATVGVTLGPGEYRWPAEVVRDADIAMYRIKTERRGGVRVFDTEMHSNTLAQYQLEMELREALERSELELRYQPIVRQSDGRVEALEALLRWRHPERGLLLPASFLELAEDTGLIVEFGAWVIERACRDWRIWRDAVPSGDLPWLSINVSPRQIEKPGIVAIVRDAAAQADIPHSAIGLEVTERSVMSNPESAGALLGELRAMGLRLLMDDFGTGQSSLSHLSNLPIQVLKIDRSFLGTGPNEEGRIKTLYSVVELGVSLGLQVVCEGVETKEQLHRLRHLGDCLVQGFFIARPVESGEVPALLRDSPWLRDLEL